MLNRRIEDLLDIPRLQAIMDGLYAASSIPSAIIDNDGKVHTGSGWQDVCTKFHRAHPEAEKRCIESDLYIKRHIREANPSVVYKCPHGLVDSATPIFVEGEHIGNVFTGQLFLEEPDPEFFRSQARSYGFDEGKYMEAVNRVPVIQERALQGNLSFIARFTELLAEMGLNRLREKEAYEAREATIGLLRICNRAGGLPELMRDLVLFFRRLTGCEAVGVRLREGEDFPYFVTRGFSGEFVAAENRLCAIDPAGELVRDYAGHPALDCMCGNVLCGRFDPSKPFFTASGSFWSSGTSELLASTTDADRQAKTRNRCNGEGYESVALIPLRTQGEIFGLFQFNDLRKGRFNAGNIALLENLVTYVAIALAKFKADETLRSSESRYRSLFENMLEGYAYCRMIVEDGDSRDFVYLDVNAAFGKLTGLKDVVGKKVTEVIPGVREKNPELFEIYGRVAATGRPERFETYVGALNIWLSISVYSPANGYFVAVFDNVTERRKLEEQLRQSQRMEAVGRLAGGVAHDFNNLLTVINGYSELLLRQIGEESPLRTDLEEIKRAGDRAANLTKQLLAFGRRQVIQPKVLDLNAVVSDMDTMLRRLIGEDIEFLILPGKGLGSVKADPGQIEQVIVNLVVNARDAMPAGGRLTIETANVSPNGDSSSKHPQAVLGPHVLLAVSDNGEGMNEDTQSHMFEPFFTTKEKGKGTGLGLSTVYGIVQQSQGHIHVRSEVGKGTTIGMYLPRHPDPVR